MYIKFIHVFSNRILHLRKIDVTSLLDFNMLISSKF